MHYQIQIQLVYASNTSSRSTREREREREREAYVAGHAKGRVDLVGAFVLRLPT